MSAGLFLSYCRTDRDLVSQLHQLLSTATTRPIFRDETDIPPGARWQDVLKQALSDATQVYVFWCHHAKQSDWVQKEYSLALELEKIVIPVLLDDTPLPEPLAPIQAVDLRRAGGHTRPARRGAWRGPVPANSDRRPGAAPDMGVQPPSAPTRRGASTSANPELMARAILDRAAQLAGKSS